MNNQSDLQDVWSLCKVVTCHGNRLCLYCAEANCAVRIQPLTHREWISSLRSTLQRCTKRLDLKYNGCLTSLLITTILFQPYDFQLPKCYFVSKRQQQQTQSLQRVSSKEDISRFKLRHINVTVLQNDWFVTGFSRLDMLISLLLERWQLLFTVAHVSFNSLIKSFAVIK